MEDLIPHLYVIKKFKDKKKLNKNANNSNKKFMKFKSYKILNHEIFVRIDFTIFNMVILA